MILRKFIKQPIESKDYDIDYSSWLVNGDTLSSASAQVQCDTNPLDVTLVVSVQVSPTKVKVWISGGTPGETYKVSVTISTASIPARVDQSELKIRVREI